MLKTNGSTSLIEDLQREIAALRQENEAYRRLASFPQTSPIPSFEFDFNGQPTYLNPAAEQALIHFELGDARLFLPDDFTQICKQAHEQQIDKFFREKKIGENIFQENIYYSSGYDVIRIFAVDITLQKLKDTELMKSKQDMVQIQSFLKAVTQGPDIIIATIDKDYRCTYFNQAYKDEVHRLSERDIHLGMDIREPFAHLPEQLQVIQNEWGRVLGGEHTNKILKFGDPGIYQQVYNIIHTPIRDAEGNVVGAGEVAYNISDQLRVQEALRVSEERYRSLFEGMTEGFAIHELLFDENGQPHDYRFLDINPAFERFTGLKREQVIGKTYRALLPNEDDRWIKAYGAVVLTGEPVQFEEYSPTLQRYYQVFAYRCAPEQFAVIFLDISERRQMEDDLRINLAKYSVLFESFPLGITVSDKNGDIIESNPEAVRLLGLSEEEQNRRKIDDKEWQIIRRDGTPMPGEEYASVRALKEQRRIDGVEMGIVKGDGQISWISVTAAPLPLKDYGVVITYQDISSRIRVEEALRRAHEDLENKVQKRTEELRLQTSAVEAQRQRFNDVLEILPAYLILLTQDYHVAFANRFFRERFGEDHGRRCYEYLFGLDAPCENCETYKVLKTGKELHWEWTGPDQHNYDVFDFPFTDVDGSTLILEMGIDITGRKQAEEKLHQLNKYNRRLIDVNLDALMTITPEGKIGDVNPVTEAITGYPRHELIGTDFHSYFTDPKKARAGYEQVFETGEVRDYELEIQHRDGHSTSVMYNASIYRDETGKVAGVLAAARDITERKQAERELVLLNTALEAAANGIIVTDKDGNIIWANSAFNKATGYSTEEVIGMNPRILKSGVHEQDFYRDLWDTILSGKVWHGELVNRRKDGSLYHEDQTITPLVDRHGTITNFISIRQDISEHKKAEEALKKSEEQYRSLVMASTQIIWQTNAQGEVVEDLPMWRELTGQSVDELFGHGWINALHPEDQPRIAGIWANSVQNLTRYDVEYRIKKASGEYGHFDVRGVPIKDGQGNVSGWVGTATDITEKKNYEDQLLQAEKHAAIGRMVGSVTHEINNPLQTIKNCMYLLQQDIGPDSPNREPLEMALSETQRLSNIVGQLRQLYRPQAGQIRRSHDLLMVVEEVSALLEPQLCNFHVEWRELPGLHHCKIDCIKDQVIEVLLNISMNAIEAMGSNGGTLSVNMVSSMDNTLVGVVLSDTGPGIKPEILPHIFEPFITTKESGLGLGLSICYGIIQKHGGQITVDSEYGHGASFTVWLPIIG